jgi:hypothetical protein
VVVERVVEETVGVVVETGVERSLRGGADGIDDESVSEDGAAGGERVHVGSAEAGRAKVAGVGALILGEDKEDVGFFRNGGASERGEGGDDGDRDEDKCECRVDEVT